MLLRIATLCAHCDCSHVELLGFLGDVEDAFHLGDARRFEQLTSRWLSTTPPPGRLMSLDENLLMSDDGWMVTSSTSWHSAVRLATGGWRLSWLPERDLSFDAAKAGVLLAESVEASNGGPLTRGRNVKRFADMVGVSSGDAVARIDVGASSVQEVLL